MRGPKVNTRATAIAIEPYKIDRHQRPNFHVNKGDVITIKAKKTVSALRCGNGGDHTLLFDPPLALEAISGSTPTTPGNCELMVEWQYNP